MIDYMTEITILLEHLSANMINCQLIENLRVVSFLASIKAIISSEKFNDAHILDIWMIHTSFWGQVLAECVTTVD